MSTFSRFAPRLQEAIVSRLGFSSLRPVQEEAGAALLDGKNAVVLAPTAGGKTEASMFPTLSMMVSAPPSSIGAIYIAPIKALLNNQAERLGNYTQMVGLDRFVWHGDTGDSERRKFLREPCELLMTTPESLEVMLVSKRVNDRKLFGDLRTIVIDEVHAMAGSDRGAHLMSIIERLAKLSRHDIQRVGLSATVGNPADILSWLQGSSRREGVVVDPPKGKRNPTLLLVHRENLGELARDAARMAKGQKSLFFCQSRSTTEAVAEHMRRSGTTVFVHHSAVSKEERQLAEAEFARGSDACVVCTSTLELGIDVGDLDRVLQAEAPDTVSSFLQRMGRTGRRDKPANTNFFCETTEGVLQAIALVSLAKEGWVESVPTEDRCWPVLIHQLLAMSLAADGISAEDAWAHLSPVPDFRGIHRAEYDRLLNWMIRDNALRLASGRLILGPKAEKRFGRKNFMELFAVFSSPQSYTVETKAGQPLGSLNQQFVDRLVDGISSFLLGGRGWFVVSVRHEDRKVVVEPAPRGKQPTWGGFLPQFLGFELCQRILKVILEDTAYPWLEASAAEVLAEHRAGMREVLRSERGGITMEEGELQWWTFAGGRINGTLRYALEAVTGDWKIIPDNFLIKVRGDSLNIPRFLEALERISDYDFWENPQLWREVSESLPNYRLSKFQPLMPPWVEREVIASYLLDVAGAWRWLAEGDPAADHLRRVPEGVRSFTREDEAELERLELLAQQRADLPKLERDAGAPLTWVRTEQELASAVEELSQHQALGLDVETTLGTNALCLIQLACPARTFLIDALEVPELTALGPLLSTPDITKLIHNASFERSVLGRYDLELGGVVDTLELSRELRGKQPDGHSLRAVCERELGLHLDKTEQAGDWTRRPLTPAQIEYAALDAEVLLRLHERFNAEGAA
ncbi:MAG: DEAD/DEAH box helicase [Polyangiaceae bacterium]